MFDLHNKVTTNSERGFFRQMNMQALRENAGNRLWLEADPSDYEYVYPLPLDPIDPTVIQKLTEGIPLDQIYRVGPFSACTSPQSHIGPYRHAIDFLVPDGTIVLAAAAGMVIEVYEESDEWGDDQSFSDKLNYVTIQTYGQENE